MKTIKKKNITVQPNVLIGTLSNGWIVEGEDGEGGMYQTTIKNDGTFTGCSLEKAKAIRELLFLIKETLCEYYSKHNEYNVDIIVRDKNEKEIEIFD